MLSNMLAYVVSLASVDYERRTKLGIKLTLQVSRLFQVFGFLHSFNVELLMA